MTTFNQKLPGLRNGAWIAVHGRVDVNIKGNQHGRAHQHTLLIEVEMAGETYEVPLSTTSFAVMLSPNKLLHWHKLHGLNLEVIRTDSNGGKLLIDFSVSMHPIDTHLTGIDVICMVPLP